MIIPSDYDLNKLKSTLFENESFLVQLFWPNSFWKDFKDYTLQFMWKKLTPPPPIVAPTYPKDHDLTKHEPTIDEEDNFSVQMVFEIRDFLHILLCKIWPLNCSSIWLPEILFWTNLILSYLRMLPCTCAYVSIYRLNMASENIFF